MVRLLTALLLLNCGLFPHELLGQANSFGVLSNSAIGTPVTQDLDLLYGAEPLGKGHYRVRLLNRSSNITVPELGNGTSFTGGYGYALGLTPAIDVSLLLPFLMDSVGGLNKYGTGDPVLGIKYSRQPRLGAGFYSGVQLLLGLPLGYKGEHALDDFSGIRGYSSESLDMGLQGLMDLHFRHLSILMNGGYFRSGNPDHLPQLAYGIGFVIGRSNRRGSLNAEYATRVAFSEQSRAAPSIKFGARINVYRGVELEINREKGFLDSPVDGQFSFGLRLHGLRSPGRRLESRYAPVSASAEAQAGV